MSEAHRAEDWPIHAVAPDIRFQADHPMPALPPDLEAAVAAIWNAAVARDPRLFNGQVFSADVITPTLVTGHWTEFRRVVAQMRDHALHARLGLRPLAVGGLIVTPDGLVFGRRPAAAVYQPGEWQLPPAGSIDAGAARPDGSVAVLPHLMTELREELGLPPEAVRDPRLLCMVEHAGSHVLDLGVALRCDWPAARLHATHAQAGNDEYAALRLVPVGAVPAFVAEIGPLLTRQGRVFLDRAGFLPGT